ncbi:MULTISPECIES: hypothetical protein [unclassified Modicisalibacter]|uniref:hypothetical protein n=1 Tax=unclassified Modicisalibacter TaxID=2679913 RepID=UPI001CCDC947|nr:MULTISPECIES: hypothetical protein [unclassified Modicisalibacter]MBZ9559093.1 hypothetical protein [Modicisalibacter sp. R2A 31.J]MBZ9576796.1 hypothetical protein [Modicisalibacter sp. MOD 31.J]
MTSTATIPTTTVGLLAHRDLGMQLPLCTLKSAAGYYIGTVHEEYGPVSRESEEYFSTAEQAEDALASGRWTQRLTSGI